MAGKTDSNDETQIDQLSSNGSTDYVLPLVHVSVPSAVVNMGFWDGLGGAVTLGVVDLPLATST